MQLSLLFQAESINLPIAYRSTQQGLLYQVLSANPAFATYMHNEGRQIEDRSYKLFTFSPLNGQYSIKDKRITFHQYASMEIRSIDTNFIQILADNLVEGANIRLGQQYVTIAQAQISEQRVSSSHVQIQTISPVVVYQTQEDGHTTFFSPYDEVFYSSIIHNAQRKWRSLGYDDTFLELAIKPIDGQVFHKVPTRFKTTFITGWHGCFEIIGLPAVVDMLYQTGLGAKNSQGFGMFRIISESSR